MIPAIITRLIILAIGVLHPAYESHRAIRRKDIQSYVRWILYWITFGLFMCAETLTDVFLSWLPFYYELKIAFVMWLVLPFTNGGNVLFRCVIRPQFSKWETVIDRLLDTLDIERLSYIVVFLTSSLHCMVNFVIEMSLMIRSKIVEYIARIRTGRPGKVVVKRRRKESGPKVKKLDATDGPHLTESDQLCGEVIARTTRANKYVYCYSKDSA